MQSANKKNELRLLLNLQKYGALASASSTAKPHINLMAYFLTDDLKKLILFSPENTRKFNNILENPSISFLVDSRPQNSDVDHGCAATLEGTAFIPDSEEKQFFLPLFIKRHPRFINFVESNENEMIVVMINIIYYISDLYHVTVIEP